MFEIKPTPGNFPGVQQTISKSLNIQLQLDIRSGKVNRDVDTVHVKIAGDGTNVGKRLHLITFGYSILNDVDTQPKVHLLAVIKCPEKYDALKESLSDVITDLKNTKTVVVDERTYNIRYYLGGDLKFLNCVMGLKSNNSKHSCIYCLCPNDQRHDVSKTWNILRSIEQIKACALRKHYSCINEPLFDFIPLPNVVPDLLHLFLRITDRLFSKFIWSLRQADNITRTVSSIDPTLHTHISKFETAVKAFGVSFRIWIDAAGQLCSTDLPVPQRLKVMRGIHLADFLPQDPKIESIQKLWHDFLRIYDDLHTTSATDAPAIRAKAIEWVRVFTSDVYMARDAICYIHLLVSHLPYFVEEHGGIAVFAQQKFEYMNHALTQAYFRGSNHRNTEALVQVLQKYNRIMMLHSQVDLKTNTYSCTICGQGDHKRSFCPKRRRLCELN